MSPTFGTRWFTSPWQGEGWETEDKRVYRSDTGETTRLRWDVEHWPITDWEPYNDIRAISAGADPRLGDRVGGQDTQFPVGDLRMRAVVRPDTDDLRLVASIRARGHTFQAAIENGRAIVRTRDGTDPWIERAGATFKGLRAGEPRRFEFWHVDQSLQVWIDGRKIVEGQYDWTPGIRLYHSTGKDGNAYGPNHTLADPRAYEVAIPSLVEWTFEGSPVTLSRVGLDRDIYYQPKTYQRNGLGRPGLATHPTNLAALEHDQYFMLGDNSPSSQDGRLWTDVDENVGAQIDPDVGVVNRKLLLGKAFFVYFPAPYTLTRVGNLDVPMPDFGNMRFIR